GGEPAGVGAHRVADGAAGLGCPPPRPPHGQALVRRQACLCAQGRRPLRSRLSVGGSKDRRYRPRAGRFPCLREGEASDQRNGNAQCPGGARTARPICRTGISGALVERWQGHLLGRVGRRSRRAQELCQSVSGGSGNLGGARSRQVNAPRQKPVTSIVAMRNWVSFALATAAISTTLSPVEPGG